MGEEALSKIKEAEESGGTWLDLSACKITDLYLLPLAELTNLEDLDLSYNEITDLSPLADLTNLEDLDLSSNEITDLSPLARLTNLKCLNLDETGPFWRSVHDKPFWDNLKVLKGLTKLRTLRIDVDGVDREEFFREKLSTLTEDWKAAIKKNLPNCEIHFS